MTEISLKEKWQESLIPFKKDNLKLYLLGTLATGIRATKTLLGTFWWFFPLIIGLLWCATYLLVMVPQHTLITTIMGGLLFIAGIVLCILLWYLIILATRPSSEPKTRSYFSTYLRSWWSVFILILFVPGNNLASIVSIPLITTIILFFLDTDLSGDAFAASFIRGTKALIYFLPGFLVIFFASMLCLVCCTLLLFGISWGTSWLLGLLLGPTSTIALFLTLLTTIGIIACAITSIIFLFAAALTVYYIKIRHEHQDFFFAQ